MNFRIIQIVLSFLLAFSAIELMGAQKLMTEPGSPRKIVIGKKLVITLCKDGKAEFEVVKPTNPAAHLAMKELIERLIQITGKKVTPVAQASGKVPAFYLGTCPEAEKLGLNPKKLDRDGYYIKTDGNRIFITGCDSWNPKKIERATLYGVYDFLERFAGVRYYFPGEIGTIVPKKKNWTLPAIDITERPDTQYRWIYCYHYRMQENVKYQYPGMKEVNPLTWRNSTLKNIRSCHGLNDLHLVKRFAKTHPEFFAMTETGDRNDGSKITTGHRKHGQLCYSSEGLKEEIYQDAAACLTGKPASSRGLSNWSARWNTMHVDLAPNDGLEWCQCTKCKKIQAQGKQAMSDHIWRFVCDIATRLKKNGIKGYVMLDAYSYFCLVPTFKIPDNVMIGITRTGPWAMSNVKQRNAQETLIRDWSRAAQAKIKLWTYPTKAGGGHKVPLVPNFTPRAVGSFYQSVKDYIYGSFVESGSDRWMYGFLNSYVASKVMWDWNTDVEKLIDEHCRLMYGKAAGQMNQFYRELETVWMNHIMGKTMETSLGPVIKVPTRREIWTKIYSPKKIAEINALLDQAEKVSAQSPQCLKRIKFMRNELWQPVVNGQKAFQAETSNRTAWTMYAGEAKQITLDGKLNEAAWKKADAVWLLSNPTTKKAEVQTRVKMLQDAKNFYFGFEADEPETAKMVAMTNRKPDDSEVWRDNGAEIFLSADTGSDFIYQFMFNSAGIKSDLENTNHTINSTYNSGFEVKTAIVPGKMWTAEVRIPRSAMPKMAGRTALVGNFTRHRVLDGVKVGTEFYAWFPKTRNIAENCGNIQLARQNKADNLIVVGDFNKAVHSKRFMGYIHQAWAIVGSQATHFAVDHEIFLTQGAALRLEKGCTVVRQNIPIEPDKQYKLSFFVRTENLIPGLRIMIRYGGQSAPGLYVLGDYRDYIRDTVDWYRVEKTFRTPKKFGKQYPPHIEFSIGRSTGKCWIDHVELIKIK